MKERLDYIDIAKGLGIILVILSHTDYPEIMYYTSPFFVPIFFFCSGYTSSRKEISIKSCYKRVAIRLLKPYLFFNILLLLIFHEFSLRAICGILYSRYCLFPFGTTQDICRFMIIGNYPLWFLTCMVVAYLLYEILIYYSRYRYYLITIYFIFSTLTTYCPVLLPWSLDTAPIMAIFMFCATFIKKEQPQVFSSRKPHPIVILSIILYFLFIPFCYDINISVRMYGPYILAYVISALTGSIVLIYLSRFIQGSIIGKFLQQTGIHSLTIFCMEIPFILFGRIIADLCINIYPQLQSPVFTAFIQVLIALIGGYSLSLLIHKNKYLNKIAF